MRIILAGSQEIMGEYRTWIAAEMSAEVSLIDDLGTLESVLTSQKCDLLIIDSATSEYRIEDLVRSVKMVRSTLPVIAICGDNSREAIEVMRLGVSDYLVKPVEKDRLFSSIQSVLRSDRGERSEEAGFETILKEEVDSDQSPLPDEFIFEGSAKMAAISQVVDKILDVDLPILITGESGTGKEVLAKYIYGKSNRNGPFVKVNCAAIPSELLESELFGYERGAFTGAYRRKPGKFEAADGGILFLDEISELSYPLQSKLLHVLQDGTIATLGSTKDIRVNVRTIVATNQDLEECVKAGTFRDDLYFRLNVVHINVPPLRERQKQLEILIDYFRDRFAQQYNTTPVYLDDEARTFLSNYRWPGNIRELENTIRRATVLGADNLLGNIDGIDRAGSGSMGETAPPNDENVHPEQHNFPVETSIPRGEKTHSDDKDPGLPTDSSLKEIAKEAALAAEKEAIGRILQQTRWNRKKTAKILGVSYKTLLTKIKETGLDEN